MLQKAFNEDSLSKTLVFEWYTMFEQGIERIADQLISNTSLNLVPNVRRLTIINSFQYSFNHVKQFSKINWALDATWLESFRKPARYS